jgi:hypothetical protein
MLLGHPGREGGAVGFLIEADAMQALSIDLKALAT